MSDDENDSRKTVDDILAEYRSDADAMDRGELYQPTTEYVRRLLDRIEAAWKRERAKVEADALAVGGIVEAARTAEKSSAVGNAAAMREALLNIQEYADAMDVDDGNVLAILDSCRDALSAPARNYDRFKDAQTAWRAWIEDADNWDEFGSPKLELCEWLLAPAKERKGEDDDA